METQITNFIVYLDKVRASRKIPRKEFTDGVISLRHYQRLLKGQVTIGNDRLTLLINRLDSTFLILYNEFLTTQQNNMNQLLEVQYLSNEKQITKAYDILKSFDSNQLNSNFTIQFYNYLKTKLEFHLGIIEKVNAMDIFESIANYPEILDINEPNIIELNALQQIAVFLYQEKNDCRVGKYLYVILKNYCDSAKDYLNFSRSALYSATAQLLGLEAKYNEALEMSEMGITYCLQRKRVDNLPNLYMLSCISFKKLLYDKSFIIDYGKKAFGLLYSTFSKESFQSYVDFYESHFGIEVQTLFPYK